MDAIHALATYPIVGYGGAKGGGKSHLGREWMILRRDKYPFTHGLILRKTYPELQSTHIKKIFEDHPGLRQFYNESKKVLTFPNGSTITFGYLQRPNDVYQYQGVEYEDVFLDEATQHPEEVFTILRTSLRTTKNYIKPRFLLTFNPGGIGHGWCKRLFFDKQFLDNENPSDYFFISAKVFDNDVLLKSNPDYIRVLEALPEKLRKAYLEGDMSTFEGQFFEEWNPDVHVIKPRYELQHAPTNFDYLLTWDDGTSNPRSVHVLAQDNDGRVEIIWEYYKRGETAIDAAENVKSQLHMAGILELLRKKGKFIYDPSMDIKNNQTGLSTSRVVSDILGIARQPGNNNRVEGARRYRDYLHHSDLTEPLLRVWSTCKDYIRTIPQLIYEDSNSEDINTDGEDHAYDDTRYGLMALTRNAARFGGSNPVTKFEPVPMPFNPFRGLLR